MALLLFIIAVALSVSFLCSLLEAALLSSRAMELSDRSRQGDRGAALLLSVKQHRLDDAISAILTLNTIAHTIGAALAGAQAAVVFGDRWVGVFSGVLTLLVLVATEIIPKTLGTTYASQLAGFVGRTVQLLMLLLKPVLVLTGLLTRLVSHGQESKVSRGEVAALVALAAQQGSLRDQESRLVANILRLESLRVADVMTPRTVTVMLPATMTVRELIESEPLGFSRIPLSEDSPDNVHSYVLHREVLWQAARGMDLDSPLSRFARPIWTVLENETLGRALRQLLERQEHLAIVGDEFGGVAGVVTLEDLVETVLGVEILDEMDEVSDLRVLALELRQQRLRRQEEIRQATRPSGLTGDGEEVDPPAAPAEESKPTPSSP